MRKGESTLTERNISRRRFLQASAAGAALPLGASASDAADPSTDDTLTYDVVVVGAGSGGLGAAITAERGGLRTLVVEKEPGIGGTATRGGVNAWETGVGGTGLPIEIYCRLKKIPDAVGISTLSRHFSWPGPSRPYFPGGFRHVDPSRSYLDTLYQASREHKHSVPFELAIYTRTVRGMLDETDRCDIRTESTFSAYAGVLRDMLAETGHLHLRTDTSFSDVTVADKRITAVTLDTGERVRARYWIDGTGDGALCLTAGCEALRGTDPRSRFGEPHAPEKHSPVVNGVSLIFRVTPVEEPAVEPLPDGIPKKCWWRGKFPVITCTEYPDGDRNVNMLPTMTGRELLAMEKRNPDSGREDAYRECRRRVRAQWHYLQSEYEEFRRYRLAWIAPMLGIRESNRVVCDYMLREQDLVAGLSGQDHDDIIAIAGHPMDTHGAAGAGGHVDEPYGVPYRCLVPEGWHNLLVACRGAGFSSIAASSCRLSRTMMQLGQAAGNAAVLADELDRDLPAVPAGRLRARQRAGHVQLEHPMPQELRDYITHSEADASRA